MDRMKKILSSPISKRKNVVSNHYFGVPLEEVVQRDGASVPDLVSKICIFIQNHGITHEGIFRVNGNSRIVEKLKASYERNGDADLASAGDVMAVAGVLKLFLRELPDAVIPENMTREFVTTQEESSHDQAECLQRFKNLLEKLPHINYDLLKYLTRFLVLVACHEDSNKMNPMALGIVFGPNLFRCSGGIDGLKQQAVTNSIVHRFIQKYDPLFLETGEISPYSSKFIQVQEAKKSRTPPARPPPPKLDNAQNSPVPSTRKSKNKTDAYVDGEDPEGSDSTPQSGSTHTPRFSDDEYLDSCRSSSPFILDSDRSEAGSGIPSPLTTLTTELVERTISSAISQHLFGDNGCCLSSDDGSQYTANNSPVPAPRKKKKVPTATLR